MKLANRVFESRLKKFSRPVDRIKRSALALKTDRDENIERDMSPFDRKKETDGREAAIYSDFDYEKETNVAVLPDDKDRPFWLIPFNVTQKIAGRSVESLTVRRMQARNDICDGL